MAPLVEALRDGRLSAREAASVERHLPTCAFCAGVKADLERLRVALHVPELSAIEHQRGRLRLLREAAKPPKRSAELRWPRPVRRPVRRWAVLASALAGIGVLASAVGVAVSLPRSAPRLYLAHLPPPPKLAERAVTRVEPEPEARFTHVNSDALEMVTLESGSVVAFVRPLARGERFLVVTADAEVEVRGTVFRVEARAQRLRSVEVREGKVEVRSRGRTWLLTADERWSAPEEEAAGVTEGPKASDEGGSSAKPPLLGPSSHGGGGARSARPAEDPAGIAFREGVGMADRGDYDAAARRLAAFAAAHPGDDRAEDAAFLVVVSLQRAGRSAEAATAARDYLARYPNGYRRAEVEQIARASAP
jgi:hypothetical protein